MSQFFGTYDLVQEKLAWKPRSLAGRNHPYVAGKGTKKSDDSVSVCFLSMLYYRGPMSVETIDLLLLASGVLFVEPSTQHGDHNNTPAGSHNMDPGEHNMDPGEHSNLNHRRSYAEVAVGRAGGSHLRLDSSSK